MSAANPNDPPPTPDAVRWATYHAKRAAGFGDVPWLAKFSRQMGNGLLILAVVFGGAFLLTFEWKGIVVAAAVGIPIALLGLFLRWIGRAAA
ncbi:hypothetical protein [Alienimonas sp. DA493]|uniref:hypothetical protein n=1 Tax=Alienimonas sp. DA493 TaxID=3373605 RepID=UPI003754F3C2